MDNVDFTGKIILIAEDEEYVRRHIARRLTGEGLRVLQAGTGEEALALCDRKPDLIVMDVRMPLLDGLETTVRLKSDPETCGIPVVLLTAMAQQDVVARGLATGADEYIMKPVTFGRLMDSIIKHMG